MCTRNLIICILCLLLLSCIGQQSQNSKQAEVNTELTDVQSAPSLVAELSYNINGIPYSALCVFYGHSGTCHVVSNIGDCWYDVFYSEYNNYVTYSISNPTRSGWGPGVCYFTPNGYFIEVQGFRYQLQSRRVPPEEWQRVMSQYGFQ